MSGTITISTKASGKMASIMVMAGTFGRMETTMKVCGGMISYMVSAR